MSIANEVKALEDKCSVLQSMLDMRNDDLEKALEKVEKLEGKFVQLKNVISASRWAIAEAGPGIKRNYVLRMIDEFLKVIDEGGYFFGKITENRTEKEEVLQEKAIDILTKILAWMFDGFTVPGIGPVPIQEETKQVLDEIKGL